jgi:hypothetical protein
VDVMREEDFLTKFASRGICHKICEATLAHFVR